MVWSTSSAVCPEPAERGKTVSLWQMKIWVTFYSFRPNQATNLQCNSKNKDGKDNCSIRPVSKTWKGRSKIKCNSQFFIHRHIKSTTIYNLPLSCKAGLLNRNGHQRRTGDPEKFLILSSRGRGASVTWHYWLFLCKNRVFQQQQV